jgi:hypothetical protein
METSISRGGLKRIKPKNHPNRLQNITEAKLKLLSIKTVIKMTTKRLFHF